MAADTLTLLHTPETNMREQVAYVNLLYNVRNQVHTFSLQLYLH